MVRILISACLLGDPVRYDGKTVATADPLLQRWHKAGRLISICPEISGGLPVPRNRAEITGGDGHAVLAGTARVVDSNGDDITAVYLHGAECALETARFHSVAIAILTEKSPSCGSAMIYDGSFSGVRRPGAGVTAALLAKNGIRIFTRHRISEAAVHLARLEKCQTKGASR